MARWFDELSRKFARFPFFAFILDITRFSQKFVTSFASRFFSQKLRVFTPNILRKKKKVADRRKAAVAAKNVPLFLSCLFYLSILLYVVFSSLHEFAKVTSSVTKYITE